MGNVGWDEGVAEQFQVNSKPGHAINDAALKFFEEFRFSRISEI